MLSEKQNVVKNDSSNGNEPNRNINKALLQTNIDISKAMFTINKLNKNANAHKVLNPNGPPQTISVLPGVPVFCKVETISTQGPYTLSFDYLNAGDCSVFLGQNSKILFPEKKTCAVSKERPDELKIETKVDRKQEASTKGVVIFQLASIRGVRVSVNIVGSKMKNVIDKNKRAEEAKAKQKANQEKGADFFQIARDDM